MVRFGFDLELPENLDWNETENSNFGDSPQANSAIGRLSCHRCGDTMPNCSDPVHECRPEPIDGTMTAEELPSQGSGPLFARPDCEAARQVFRAKSKSLTDKVMSVSEAVERFVADGDYLVSGGFGGDRIATALLHEIVRQRKKVEIKLIVRFLT